VDLTPTPEAILNAMDAKSCRYDIRRAAKLGARLRMHRGLDAREDFFQLYNAFVTWKGYTKPITRRRVRHYLESGTVFVASVDSEPVAAHLVTIDPHGSRGRLIFSASARFAEGELGKLASPVNRWLHWEEMQALRADGIRTYDFGGGASDSSIGRFKLSF